MRSKRNCHATPMFWRERLYGQIIQSRLLGHSLTIGVSVLM